MKTVRLVAFALVMAVVVTACGSRDDEGSSGGSDDRTTSTTASATGDGTTTTPGQARATSTTAGTTATTRATGSAPAPTTPGGATTTTPKRQLDVKVTATPACVRPGGTLTITIDMGEGGVLLYYIAYSDNRGGPMGSSLVEGTGHYTTTETIGDAPAGPATVNVRASSSGGKAEGQGQAPFTVAGPTGTCT